LAVSAPCRDSSLWRYFTSVRSASTLSACNALQISYGLRSVIQDVLQFRQCMDVLCSESGKAMSMRHRERGPLYRHLPPLIYAGIHRRACVYVLIVGIVARYPPCGPEGRSSCPCVLCVRDKVHVYCVAAIRRSEATDDPGRRIDCGSRISCASETFFSVASICA
jgi:hypothetical protein